MKLTIDTENLTVTIKEDEFLITDLIEILTYYNILNYKIIFEQKIIKEYPPVNIPYVQPVKPWWEKNNPYTGTGGIINTPCTTSNTTQMPINDNITYTK